MRCFATAEDVFDDFSRELGDGAGGLCADDSRIKHKVQISFLWIILILIISYGRKSVNYKFSKLNNSCVFTNSKDYVII